MKTTLVATGALIGLFAAIAPLGAEPPETFELPFETYNFKLNVKLRSGVQFGDLNKQYPVYVAASDHSLSPRTASELLTKLGFPDDKVSECLFSSLRPNGLWIEREVNGMRQYVDISSSDGATCAFSVQYIPRRRIEVAENLSQEKIREIAETALKQRDLWSTNMYCDGIRCAEVGGVGKDGMHWTKKTAAIVTFRQRLEGYTSLSEKVEVDLVEDGKLRAIYFYMRDWRKVGTFPVVVVNEAVDRAKAGKYKLIRLTGDLKKDLPFLIDKVSVVYFGKNVTSKGNAVYQQPVYSFQGRTGEEEFTLLVPALKDDVLKWD